jgi:hypothetical protein
VRSPDASQRPRLVRTGKLFFFIEES